MTKRYQFPSFGVAVHFARMRVRDGQIILIDRHRGRYTVSFADLRGYEGRWFE